MSNMIEKFDLSEAMITSDSGVVLRNRAIDAVYTDRDKQLPMTVEDVQMMDSTFRLGGGKKEIFGQTVEDLVRKGFLITPDMYRTTTFGPIAQESASYLVTMLESYFPREKDGRYKGIEGCTGTGSQTFALASQEGKLWIDITAEQSSKTAFFTRQNLQKLGLEGLNAATYVGDIVEMLEYAKSTRISEFQYEYDWVMLDPDWEGKPFKTECPFTLKEMRPDGENLVGLGLQVAPVVAIKAPETVRNEEFDRIARQLNVAVLVRDIKFAAEGTSHKERFAYFVNHRDLIAENGTGLISITEKDVKTNIGI
jgi:hypothetical protein